MIVGGALALLEQLTDLRQGEKGQLYLIRLDLPDIGERILSYPGTELIKGWRDRLSALGEHQAGKGARRCG